MIYSKDEIGITISDRGVTPTEKKSYSKNSLISANYKIYILKLKEEYLYVGKTKQKIGTKFQQGFKAYKNALNGKRKSGYGGYKWIKKYINSNKTLQTYVFDLGAECVDNNAEAIEAEVVYEIRKRFGKWPECQNEIHFFNDYEDASDIANEILKLTDQMTDSSKV